MPIPNPPFRPTDESQVCRGKSGSSKTHRHYRGGHEQFVRLEGRPTLVNRCTSCEKVIVWRLGPDYRPVTLDPELLDPAKYEELGRALVAAL